MLALIAGTGDLPPALVVRLPERPLICAMAGIVPAVAPDLTFRIEQLGSFLADLAARGVTEVCLAGAVKRPAIDPIAIDAATMPLVPRIMAAIAQGDDGALRAIIAIFEEAGLHVRAAHEIAPDLLPPEGVLTEAKPEAQVQTDALQAVDVIADMGQKDMGQACILHCGQVLAREGQDGTDAMIAAYFGTETTTRNGAILYKAPKPAQDRRADLPVIGPRTARAAVQAGLAGIVIAHQGVMVLDLAEVLTVLNEGGLFLWVRSEGAA